MKSNFRPREKTTQTYGSLSEACMAFGAKERNNTESSSEKKEKQKEKFLKKHICRACGKPMTYLGGNMMTCTNTKCKGIKIENTDADGNTHYSYTTSYELLDDIGVSIAQKVFA